jgi:hypothetical protein
VTRPVKACWIHEASTGAGRCTSCSYNNMSSSASEQSISRMDNKANIRHIIRPQDHGSQVAAPLQNWTSLCPALRALPSRRACIHEELWKPVAWPTIYSRVLRSSRHHQHTKDFGKTLVATCCLKMFAGSPCCRCRLRILPLK